jgi:hypothetical protein
MEKDLVVERLVPELMKRMEEDPHWIFDAEALAEEFDATRFTVELAIHRAAIELGLV